MVYQCRVRVPTEGVVVHSSRLDHYTRKVDSLDEHGPRAEDTSDHGVVPAARGALEHVEPAEGEGVGRVEEHQEVHPALLAVHRLERLSQSMRP